MESRYLAFFSTSGNFAGIAIDKVEASLVGGDGAPYVIIDYNKYHICYLPIAGVESLRFAAAWKPAKQNTS